MCVIKNIKCPILLSFKQNVLDENTWVSDTYIILM